MEGISSDIEPSEDLGYRQKLPISEAALFSRDKQQGGLMRVLLVEDHADTRWAMVRLLEAAGYEVLGVSGARAALSLVATETFDVIISDIGLVETDGNELMRQVRLYSAMPGIALSGYDSAEDKRKSEEAGFSDYLIKPIELAALDDAIQRLVVRKHS